MGKRKNHSPAVQRAGNTGGSNTRLAGPRAGTLADHPYKLLVVVIGVVVPAIGLYDLLCRRAERGNKALRTDVNELRVSLDAMRRSADTAIKDAKESLQREIYGKVEKAKIDINSATNSAIDKLQKEMKRLEDQSANGLTVVRGELSALSTVPSSGARSGENTKYHVTIYYDTQTEELFKECRRRLEEVGFAVNGLDRTRALAIMEQLKSSKGEPKWSLNEIGANTITATEDALPKARQICDLLGTAGIGVGREVLDWGQFRNRYGDSMLTKAFPNATGLIEVYLLVGTGSTQP